MSPVLPQSLSDGGQCASLLLKPTAYLHVPESLPLFDTSHGLNTSRASVLLCGLLWPFVKAERELLRTLYPSLWIAHCFKNVLQWNQLISKRQKSGGNTCPIINFPSSSPANIDKKHSVFSRRWGDCGEHHGAAGRANPVPSEWDCFICNNHYCQKHADSLCYSKWKMLTGFIRRVLWRFSDLSKHPSSINTDFPT